MAHKSNVYAHAFYLVAKYVRTYVHICVCMVQGRRESLRGAQGKIYVVTALIEYLNFLLEYINLFGAHKHSGAQGKMPQFPPPLGGPAYVRTYIRTYIFATYRGTEKNLRIALQIYTA